VYHIPAKLEDSEISSDGEFNDANKMQVYNENATEVYVIEKVKDYIANNSQDDYDDDPSLPDEVKRRFIE
jgi:hypothetical protein